MAQFRVEFRAVDEASWQSTSSPSCTCALRTEAELIARTEALYANQAAAVLGLVQIFKDAVLEFPGAAGSHKENGQTP